MNIAQIRYFVTAAQLQNLSKASAALHLSQPALSKSIAKLEEELGTPLFVRQGKRVFLNEAGQRFLQSAWVILRHMDNTMLDLSEMTVGGGIRISVGLYQPDEKVSGYIAEFAAMHPGIEMDINCFIDSDPDLDINKYDMLIYPERMRYEKYKSHFIWTEPYLLAVPTGHPLATQAEVRPQELHGLRFAFLSREQRFIEEPYYLCAGLNVRVKAMYFTNAREQHRQMIASGVALGFVPGGCAPFYREHQGIKLVPIVDERFSRRIMVCFKRDKHLSDAAMDFRTFMTERLGLEKKQGKKSIEE